MTPISHHRVVKRFDNCNTNHSKTRSCQELPSILTLDVCFRIESISMVQCNVIRLRSNFVSVCVEFIENEINVECKTQVILRQ